MFILHTPHSERYAKVRIVMFDFGDKDMTYMYYTQIIGLQKCKFLQNLTDE